jgi:hypothetical protein
MKANLNVLKTSSEPASKDIFHEPYYTNIRIGWYEKGIELWGKKKGVWQQFTRKEIVDSRLLTKEYKRNALLYIV